MKHLLSRTLTALMLALIGLATTAQAQSAPVIKVNVPFEFTVGDRNIHAANDVGRAEVLLNCAYVDCRHLPPVEDVLNRFPFALVPPQDLAI